MRWQANWTDQYGNVHDTRPLGWTDSDENAVAVWLRSKRLVHRIYRADVVQYHNRMDSHIARRLESVNLRQTRDQS